MSMVVLRVEPGMPPKGMRGDLWRQGERAGSVELLLGLALLRVVLSISGSVSGSGSLLAHPLGLDKVGNPRAQPEIVGIICKSKKKSSSKFLKPTNQGCKNLESKRERRD